MKNDFKSSEFNGIISDRDQMDIRCMKIEFETARKIKSISVGFDFISDIENNPVIAEMGYGFIPDTYKDCKVVYWDEELKWHEAKFYPEDWMVEEFVNEVINKRLFCSNN